MRVKMSPIFKKMNLKDQSPILVLNAPEGFQTALELLPASCVVESALEGGSAISYAVIFIQTAEEVTTFGPACDAILKGDGLLWFAYPKARSKNYRSEVNRDSSVWEVLGKLGYEPVRLVSIDEDWSALRFRRVEYIKKMTRDATWALSELGKEKVQR